MKRVTLLFGFIFLLLINLFSPTNIVYATNDNFSVDAKASYLIDYNTGEVLFKHNEDEKLPVASIVKLMTILLTLENVQQEKLNLTDIVVASQKASGMGGSQVFIETGGSYTIGDLLKSVIVSSANDASVVLAESIAGSEQNFVSMMNQRAQELGLTSTNYVNCTGLPAPNQYSCAKDIAVLLKEVTKHNIYHNYSNIWIDKIKHGNNRETELVNTNKLIRYYKGCDGGKTGSTNEAGYCLAATAKRGDMRLIAVVLGAKSGKERFAQVSNLLNYGFNNFENKKLISKDSFIDNQIKVIGGVQNAIQLSPKADMYALVKKMDKGSISTKFELPQTLKAPIKKGQLIGKIYLIKNDQVIAVEDVIAGCDIVKLSFSDNINNIFDNWKLVSNK